MIALYLGLALVSWHYVADFALQSDWLAKTKGLVGKDPHGIHALVAHSVHHGAGTSLIIWTFGFDAQAAVISGLAVASIHGFIDHWKCQGLFGIHFDQTMHLLCLATLSMALVLPW